MYIYIYIIIMYFSKQQARNSQLLQQAPLCLGVLRQQVAAADRQQKSKITVLQMCARAADHFDEQAPAAGLVCLGVLSQQVAAADGAAGSNTTVNQQTAASNSQLL
jgi:hypothetical protein